MLKEQLYPTGELQLNAALGPANGPPLLLLHGVTATWQTFLPLIPALAETYQLFALDLRGHGLSDKVTGGYRLVDYAADIPHFIRDHLPGSTLVLGHSFGALIALYLAAELPALIRAIILLDPPLVYRTMPLKDSPWPVDQAAYHWFVTAYKLAASTTSADELAGNLARIFPAWPAERRQSLAQRLSRMDPEVLGLLVNHRHMEGYHLDELLQRITCPALVIHGNRAHGAALTPVDAGYLGQNLSRCTFVYLEEAGHNLHETHPKEVIARVTGFLSTM